MDKIKIKTNQLNLFKKRELVYTFRLLNAD